MTRSGESRRILIVGAGAMGCLFAARLAVAGHDVTLVDTDLCRIAIINEQGLLLNDDVGTRSVTLRAAIAGEIEEPVDLLIFFTKGHHTRAAVESVTHLACSRPGALSLQNGIGNAEIIAETFGWERTLFGTAHVPAVLELPNRLRTQMPNALALGGADGRLEALAHDVVLLLANAGFNATASTDIRKTVWEKLAFNAALNAPAIICEKTNGGLDNPPGLRIARAVLAETVAVARAKGIDLDSATIDSAICLALKDHQDHKASMLQDREAGRLTEIRMINGAINHEGKKEGIPTPVCSTLTDLVDLIEMRPWTPGVGPESN